jgi:uncharacterized Zn finger protein
MVGYLCKFCDAVGHINMVVVKLQGDEDFPLEWCSECGKVQSRFK